MAQATATDVLSVAELKYELRLPASETSQDALLTRQISAACSFLGRLTVAPLIDRTVRLRANVSAADRPVYVRGVGLRSVSAIRYWTPDGEFREEPDGTLAVAGLGRTYPVGRACLCVWPPAAGWPERLENSRLQVDVVQGIEIDSRTEALKQAVVVLVRQLHTGYKEFRPLSTLLILVDDWVYRGPILPEPEVVTVAPDPTPHPTGGHTRRVGWSALPHTDAGFDARAAFQSGETFRSNVLTVPDTFGTAIGGYVIIGITDPPGDPVSILREGNTRNVRDAWTDDGVIPDIDIDLEPHEVIASNAELRIASIGGATLTIGY